ncbi:hypothetical protein OHS71_25345 [Streptomyces sp. NBC_00377]|uniref:hypothetical protein n=1 Tax=unclassified Streptomyces TaxID=2593676 RepID=UPI002E1F7F55|nr:MULTISPECIES: hypothetical protein [unclassified Streptomyces]
MPPVSLACIRNRTPSGAAAGGLAGTSAPTGHDSAEAAAPKSGGLASTGSTDLAAWTATTGLTALAGGLLLRRRGRGARGEER